MTIPVPLFIEAALKSTAVLGLALIGTQCLRNKSAALRHQVWFLALAATLVLPLLSTSLPALRLSVAPSMFANNPIFQTTSLATAANGHAYEASSSIQRRVTDSGLVLSALWAFGTAISLAQMLVGWLAVARLRRSAKPIPFAEIDSDVELRETAAGSMPVTYGCFRPTILLPADANEWSAERRRVVLLHELAHVRRHDAATQLLARLALALYWWQPLAWLAYREALRERELAADDLVVNAGENASTYASHLLAIARSTQAPVAALAMARPSQLEFRLAAILDANVDRRSPRRAIAFLAAIAIVTPIAALRAQVIAPQAASSADAPRPSSRAIEQGKVALSAKNFEAATAFFNTAILTDPQQTSEGKMWLAITQQNQGNREAAAALYKDALAVAEHDSLLAATISELYAKVLLELNGEDEAKKLTEQAAADRRQEGARAAAAFYSTTSARKIGGEVRAPKLLSKVEPQYSEDARLAKYDGAVLLAVEIGADGVPDKIVVIRSLGLGLDQKAIEAVRQWRFSPGIVDGKPVPVQAQIEVQFRLL